MRSSLIVRTWPNQWSLYRQLMLVYMVVSPVRLTTSSFVIFCCHIILKIQQRHWRWSVLIYFPVLLTGSTFCCCTVGYRKHRHYKQPTLCLDGQIGVIPNSYRWSSKYLNVFRQGIPSECLLVYFTKCLRKCKANLCACWWKLIEQCLKVFRCVIYELCIICKEEISYIYLFYRSLSGVQNWWEECML